MNDPPLDDTVQAQMQRHPSRHRPGSGGRLRQCPQHGGLEALREDLSVGLFGDRGRAGIPVVPKRSAATNADAATPSEPVKNGHPVAVRRRPPTRGLVDAIVAAAVSVSVRETIAYFGPV